MTQKRGEEITDDRYHFTAFNHIYFAFHYQNCRHYSGIHGTVTGIGAFSGPFRCNRMRFHHVGIGGDHEQCDSPESGRESDADRECRAGCVAFLHAHEFHSCEYGQPAL